MDAVALSAITSAVTVLASEIQNGVASAAGKAIWSQLCSILSWNEKTPFSDTSIKVAQRLSQDDKLASEVVKLLKSSPGPESSLVARIDSERVVVAETINIKGDFNM